jgi:type IV pilus assembly protein PilV
VFRNNDGFTLIEVLVSLLILMVMMMGILESLCVAIQHNMGNQLRNEGVRVADTEMAREMSKGFANVSTVSGTTFRSRRVMNALRNYSVSRSGNSLTNSKTVTFVISWYYKNQRYTHTVSSAIATTSQQ